MAKKSNQQTRTASQRVAASTAALIAAGGARKTFRLSPAAHQALKTLITSPSSPATATALIEQLLINALKNKGKNDVEDY